MLRPKWLFVPFVFLKSVVVDSGIHYFRSFYFFKRCQILNRFDIYDLYSLVLKMVTLSAHDASHVGVTHAVTVHCTQNVKHVNTFSSYKSI